jgi:hypothetical protein
MAQTDKAYQIDNASKNPVTGITVDGHNVEMEKNGSVYVHDTGLAQEIDARYGYKSREATGGKVVVIPVDDMKPTGRTMFVMPELPWKRKE